MWFYANRGDSFLPVRVSTSDSSPISVPANVSDGNTTEQLGPAYFSNSVTTTSVVFVINYKVNNFRNTNQHVVGTGPGFWQTGSKLLLGCQTLLSHKTKMTKQTQMKNAHLYNWHLCVAGIGVRIFFSLALTFVSSVHNADHKLPLTLKD